MEDTKVWWKSAGVLGSLAAVGAGAAGMLGYTISPDDQAQIVATASKGVEIYASVASLVGGLVALWGRVRATKRIG